MKAASPPSAATGLTGSTGIRTDGDVTHANGLALAPGAHLASTPDTVRPGLGITALTVIGLAISTMPLVWIVVVAIAMVSAWALGMVVAYIDRPQLQELQPEAVLSQEIRGAYRAILSAFADLAQLVEETPRLRASVAPALERCRAAVATCGQMARHADLLQRYLDRHDRTHICLELERLQERRGDAADAPRNLAAAARARQLATYDEIVGQRDLLRARLELVRVAIESFTATLVKLRGADRKQPALGDPAIIGQLDEVCR